MPQFTAVLGPPSPSILGSASPRHAHRRRAPSVFAGYLTDRFGRLRTAMFCSSMSQFKSPYVYITIKQCRDQPCVSESI